MTSRRDYHGIRINTLKDIGQWQNTLIIFLSDNGGCTEELRDDYIGRRVRAGISIIGTPKTRDGRDVRFGNEPGNMPGPEDTYVSYGVPWANVSDTPFRLYKRWVHEGGISTPLIIHWPEGITAKGELRHQPGQLPDIMMTVLDVAGLEYPSTYDGRDIKPAAGFSLKSTFSDQPHKREALYWEHEGNRAVRKGNWKLVSKFPDDWELYDMENDRTELNDLSDDHPEKVRELENMWGEWAKRVNAVPWDSIMQSRRIRFQRARTSQ